MFLWCPGSKILSCKIEVLFKDNRMSRKLLSSMSLNLDITETFGRNIQIDKSPTYWNKFN